MVVAMVLVIVGNTLVINVVHLVVKILMRVVVVVVVVLVKVYIVFGSEIEAVVVV